MQRVGLLLVVPIAVATFVVAPPGRALARTWSDSTGRFKINAELDGMEGDTVRLKIVDTGKFIRMPLDKLSKEDQDFVNQEVKKNPDLAGPAKGKAGKSAGKSAAPENKSSGGAAKMATVKSASADGVEASIFSLTVSKGLPPIKAEPGDQLAMMMNAATISAMRLSLLLKTDSARTVVGLDDSQSKIVACTDDRGTNLMKPADAKPAGPFMLQPMIFQSRPDGSGIVEMMQLQPPAAGALKIHLKAELHVQCGSGEKSSDQPDVALAKGGTIPGGPAPLKIEDVNKQDFGPMKMIVSLSSDKPLTNIKKISLVNASGAEVPSQDMGGGGFNFPGQKGFRRTLAFREAVDKGLVRIVVFDKVETVKIPLELEFGVGL